MVLSKLAPISLERQMEIALLLVKFQIKNKEITSPNTLKRELGNIAKNIGIETNEMIAFAMPLYEEAIESALGLNDDTAWAKLDGKK